MLKVINFLATTWLRFIGRILWGIPLMVYLFAGKEKFFEIFDSAVLNPIENPMILAGLAFVALDWMYIINYATKEKEANG